MFESISMSQRDNYVPSGFTKFLWWLSTAEQELLKDCVVDRNRFRIIGMTVFTTWIFATLAWMYFFSTIINNLLAYIPLGIFMGFVILTIDRALIKGITRFNKNKFSALIFRGLLAFTIGLFMAQPAILYMFDKEIKLQTSFDNEKRKSQKHDELVNASRNRKVELNTKRSVIRTELKDKYAEVSLARTNFIAETDGSGGSGKIGLKDIAAAKKNEYEKLDREYKEMVVINSPGINELNNELNAIDDNIKQEEKNFEAYLNDGFLTRIQALNNLVSENSALQFRYYLLVIILMLIELMPVIAKTLLPSGSYDEKARLREEMEKQIAFSNSEKEQQLKELYNTLAGSNDEESIKKFFELTKYDRNEKLKDHANEYRTSGGYSFDKLWGMMKREVLSKQES